LLHAILPGVNRAASVGVFVNIRKPDRTSFDSHDSSFSAGSVSGFFGSSHAVTIVVRDEINDPGGFPADDGRGCAGEHAVRARIAAETDKYRRRGVIGV
jgi:hypothetical protein